MHCWSASSRPTNTCVRRKRQGSHSRTTWAHEPRRFRSAASAERRSSPTLPVSSHPTPAPTSRAPRSTSMAGVRRWCSDSTLPQLILRSSALMIGRGTFHFENLIRKILGNPGGSLEASRRSFNKDFLLALTADFKRHGPEAIAKVRKQHPAVYLKVCAHLVPREMQF